MKKRSGATSPRKRTTEMLELEVLREIRGAQNSGGSSSSDESVSGGTSDIDNWSERE